ncbi:MAG: restriction endonuclease subunit S [Bacteroidales bacterium]|nr:restriction endonuclease subunit S [Bacteroidales bacterium]MCF8456420.1 restriction endonuclease subunit S [Bacteroidales bacterium]
MKTKLSSLGNIQTGVFAKPTSKGEIVYLQAKHFDENGKLISQLFPDLKADSIKDRHLLHPGDILFSAKGTKNFAAVFQSENEAAVASTAFFVIRLHESIFDKLIPEYLAWFINHPTSQKILKGKARGSSMASISKVVLGDLEIVIPEIQKQKTILKIAGLKGEEDKLVKQISTLKEKYIQQQLINSIL